MKKIIAFFFLLISMQLTACNTVQGVGKDIKATGEAISNSAEKAKQKM